MSFDACLHLWKVPAMETVTISSRRLVGSTLSFYRLREERAQVMKQPAQSDTPSSKVSIRKDSSCPLSSSLSGNQWSAFSHYRLVCILFWKKYRNGIASMYAFFFLVSFIQFNSSETHPYYYVYHKLMIFYCCTAFPCMYLPQFIYSPLHGP